LRGEGSAYWVVRIAVWCGMAKATRHGLANANAQTCVLCSIAITPRLGFAVDCCQFQRRILIPKSCISALFELAPCQRGPLANTCSRRSCAALQAIAGLATVLQTGASRFSASLIRPCLAKARCCDRRQWSSQSGAGLGRAARISAQHRDSWAAALRCAKSALRYLPGTAPGTAQRCLE
jgi:hypothetical protein